MNQFTLNKPSINHDSVCGNLVTMAERELAAFFNAVTELFGPEQADVSAEDWLRELKASDDLPATPRQWQLFTSKVLARLAIRVHASSSSMPIARQALAHAS